MAEFVQVHDWRVPARVESEMREARPQDMAIWRAILASEERFFYLRWDGARRARAAVLALNLPWDGMPKTLRSARRVRCLLRNPHELALFRFVLFTHPFTGARAVYSEAL